MAERRELLKLLDQGLLRATGSVRGEDDLVDTMGDQPVAPAPQLPIGLTQPLDQFVPPVFDGSGSRPDFSDEPDASGDATPEAAEVEVASPVIEPEVIEPEADKPVIADPAGVPEPGDEIPVADTFGPDEDLPAPSVEEGFVSLTALGAEVGRSRDDLVGLCGKLGIALVQGADTVTEAQADRIRGRVARENKG